MLLSYLQLIYWLIIFIIPTSNLVYAAHTFDECNAVQKNSLRDQLHNISRQVLSAKDNNLNTKPLVEAAWQSFNMDFILDKAANNAVREVERDLGFIESFQAFWSELKIKALAEKVANRTFDSEAFNVALKQISIEVTQAISSQMEKITTQSASASLLCLKTFIGDRYSATMADALEVAANAGMQNINIAQTLPNTVPINTNNAQMGAGILVASVILKPLVRKIFQTVFEKIATATAARILGKLGAVLIPGIGWALIAVDAYNFVNGPSLVAQIGEGIKHTTVKDGIKTEMANLLQEQFILKSSAIAIQVADAIFDAWIDFKAKFRQVLELADNVPEFKAILDNTAKDELLKLSSFISFMLKHIGKEELIAAIKNGTFTEALEIPDSGLQILEYTQSFATLMAWHRLAGSKLEQVIALEVYKHKMPNDFDKPLLIKLLEVHNQDIIARLSLLDTAAMRAMLTISNANLQRLSNMHLDDMRCIANYIHQMDATNKLNIIDYIIAKSDLTQLLCHATVQSKILSATNKSELIEFIIVPSDYISAFNDLLQIIDQGLPLIVLMYKYNAIDVKLALSILGFLILVILISLFKNFQQSHLDNPDVKHY